jgi:CRP-like cAMP-binding protein
LIYLSSGEAEVSSSGRTIASCREKSFIGEMTAISGEAATASVVLSQPSRYFAIPADQLRAALRRDGELRAHIETCFAGAVMQ